MNLHVINKYNIYKYLLIYEDNIFNNIKIYYKYI